VSDLAAAGARAARLPPDATDEQVTAALDARLGEKPPAGTGTSSTAPPTTTPPPAEGQTSTDGEQATGAPQGETLNASALERLIDSRVQALVDQRVAAATAPLQTALTAASTELENRRKAEATTARDRLISAALGAGKITPAEREKWTQMYDVSPEGAAAVKAALDALPANKALPVRASGHAGDAEPSGDGFTDAEYASLFPDERRTGAAS
jgi:phage I-like protein